MAGIVFQNISKRFAGGIVACDSLDLEVRDGELLALMGPSGSGKSTLLRLVAGLARPTSGTIRIGERVVNEVPARRRNVALVFQSPALYPHWTVRQNLTFGLRRRRLAGWLQEISRSAAGEKGAGPSPGEETQRRILETASQLGIEPLLDRMPGELSGGEAQRVALGRAMIRRPTVFLFDEPLSNLDAPLRLELRRQIKRLHVQLGATMLYVTHDQAEALALGDRVAVIHQGRIEQIGEPQEMYDRPANRFVAGFVGGLPMNFFDARPTVEDAQTAFTLSAGNWSIAADRRWWRPLEADGQYTVGVRPEDIRILESPISQPSSLIPHPASDQELAVPARVELIEPQGESSLVTIGPPSPRTTDHGPRTNSKNPASPKWPGAVLCRSRSCSGLKPGEQVIALFDMRRAHWFDGHSGRNLGSPGVR